MIIVFQEIKNHCLFGKRWDIKIKTENAETNEQMKYPSKSDAYS
jgi:hypothetical protein